MQLVIPCNCWVARNHVASFSLSPALDTVSLGESTPNEAIMGRSVQRFSSYFSQGKLAKGKHLSSQVYQNVKSVFREGAFL